MARTGPPRLSRGSAGRSETSRSTGPEVLGEPGPGGEAAAATLAVWLRGDLPTCKVRAASRPARRSWVTRVPLRGRGFCGSAGLRLTASKPAGEAGMLCAAAPRSFPLDGPASSEPDGLRQAIRCRNFIGSPSPFFRSRVVSAGHPTISAVKRTQLLGSEPRLRDVDADIRIRHQMPICTRVQPMARVRRNGPAF